ncbi:MAG: autotransporter domain-containing protein [Chthoniobacter sp.]|nr:autotransporter domain-containing protein [Chthoniobacter sp.]
MSRPRSQKKRPAVLTTSVAALLTLGFLLSSPKASADEYWDGTNTAGSGMPNGAGGSGTWDNVTTNWVDATGTVPQVYNPNDTAHFAGTAGTMTVTLGDNITFTALSFDVDGYTIAPGTGPFTLTPNAGATITTASGVTATINPVITGGGSIIFQGSGTTSLTATNNYTGGTTLNSGTLFANNTGSSSTNSAFGSGTLTINGGTIGTTTAGSSNSGNPVVIGNHVVVGGDFSISTFGNTDLVFSGAVDLGGATRTITGLTPGAQDHFSGVISNGGITLTTNATVNADATTPYVAFIYDGSVANTYTGLTTVTGHAILVLENGVTDGAVKGDVDVEGNGVVDYIFGSSSPGQIVNSSTVTVNSTGNSFSGTHFDGFELRNASDTIGTLNGTGTVGLGSGTLTIAVGGNFSGVIEDGAFGGGGNLTMNGTGTLVLSGANTYTGLTTITNGTIQAGAVNTIPITSAVVIEAGGIFDLNNFNQSVGEINDSITGGGAGTINLGSATLTTGNKNVAQTFFSGVIQGTGNLTKVGTGTLFIEGNGNTYTGNTTVNGGAIFLDGTLVSPVIVNSGGAFDLSSTGHLNTPAGTTAVTANTNGTFNNFGTLTVTGASAVHLTGDGATANNFSGSTITGATGILVDNATGVASILNFGTITGSGGTSVNATNSTGGVTIGDFGTFNGQVLLGTGKNTVILAAQTTFTPIAGGPGSNDTLRLAGGGEDTLKLGDFPGYEILDKVGGGMWHLTGNTSFSGGTKIEAGTLSVQGTLVSNTVVGIDGTLTGTGTVAGNLTNFGALLPGTPVGPIPNSATPGTLSVKGNYTQNSSGAMIIQINGTGAGQYSQVAVTGHAQLDGRLVLQKDGGGTIKLKMGQKLAFLTAGGGVSGTFSDVVNPFAGGTIVVSKLVYEANAVALEGTQGSFLSIDSQVHYTPNQKAVATMLDGAIADKRSAKLMTFLDNRQINQLPDDFDHIAPEEMASVYRIGVSLADVQARNVQRRTADIRAGASGFSTSGFQSSAGMNYNAGAAGPTGADGKTAEASAPDQRWSTFITGAGDFAHVGESANAASYDLNTGGVTVGADYRLTPKLVVGMTVGYTGTSANLTEDGRLLVNGGKVGAYGTYYDKGYYGDVAVTGGANNYSTRRSSLDGDASGSTQGTEMNVLVDTGYDWRLDALTIGPSASFQYTYVGIDGFTEHGSLTPLRYVGQHQSSIRSTFGLRMAYDWKVGNVIVRPEGQLAWQHEFGDRSYSIDSTLASGAGDMFSVSDSEIGRDSLLFGAGVAVLWNTRTSTYLYYDTDLLKKEYNAQSVTGGLRLNF